MPLYISRRVLALLPIGLLTTLFIFTLMRVVPGDVAVAMLGEDEIVDYARLEALRRELGLDRPIHEQYLAWVSNAVRLEFGESFIRKEPVSDLIARGMGPSLQLALMSLIVMLMISWPIGLISAYRRGTWPDYVARAIGLTGLAIPNFWLGVMLILGLAVAFRWSVPVEYVAPQVDLLHNLQKMIWPALISGYSGSALASRMIRSSILEVLREDYIRTARAKGLHEGTIRLHHAVRNAILPVVTVFGIWFAAMVSGNVIMESLFNIPGIGSLLIEGLLTRDYPVIEATVLVIVIAVVLVNLTVDLLYVWINPAVQYT